MESSNSIFILTDKLCLETDKQDASTILRAMALKRYTLEAAGVTVPMNVQIIKPENANNFKEFKNTAGVIDQVSETRRGEKKEWECMNGEEEEVVGILAFTLPELFWNENSRRRVVTGWFKVYSCFRPATNNPEHESLQHAIWTNQTYTTHTLHTLSSPRPVRPSTVAHAHAQIVCVEELKMNLLGKSVECPGISTLLSNLITSDNSEFDFGVEWVSEYMEGAGLELYRAPLGEPFAGVLFSQAVSTFYEQSGAIMFALEITPPTPRHASSSTPGLSSSRTSAPTQSMVSASPPTSTRR